jgi:hypothetical protein
MGWFPGVDKEIVSEEKDKPVLDEQTLANLLEAAYVLQEHNRKVQAMELDLSLKRDQIETEERSVPTSHQGALQTPETESTANADYTFTLAKIVETQHQIQIRHLESGSAMSLVAERLTQIARANGAAIGVLDGMSFHYQAAAGLLKQMFPWRKRSASPASGPDRLSAAPTSTPNFFWIRKNVIAAASAR